VRPLTWGQVCARRLSRNRLLERAPRGRLEEVVSAVCGIHAQVTAAAELAIAARVADVTQAEVREALWERRSLVKAPTLRGTLHLHPPEELPLWIAARSAFPRDGVAWWFEERGLDATQRRELEGAVDRAVGSEPLTRAEIAEAAAAELGAWAREPLSTSWNFLVPRRGMCYGPDRGRNVTFLRFDAWTGRRWEEPEPREAIAWAARRFLAAYGPASPAEFAHWFALKPAQAAELFASLDLEEVELGGRPAFVAADDAAFRQRRVETVRLLPAYDVYVIGAHPRELLIPRERRRIFDRGAGPFPSLLLDGVVAGTWSREKRGRRLEIVVEPFGRLARAQREDLDAEAARIGAFLGLEPVLRVAR
jgi:hypothetical protein